VTSQSSVPGGATPGGQPGRRYTSAMVKGDCSPLSLMRSSVRGRYFSLSGLSAGVIPSANCHVPGMSVTMIVTAGGGRVTEFFSWPLGIDSWPLQSRHPFKATRRRCRPGGSGSAARARRTARGPEPCATAHPGTPCGCGYRAQIAPWVARRIDSSG
jgi:hypothetical protein